MGPNAVTLFVRAFGKNLKIPLNRNSLSILVQFAFLNALTVRNLR